MSDREADVHHTSGFVPLAETTYVQGHEDIGWPEKLTISFTERCNLRCIMCATHSPQAPLKEYFDLPDVLFVKLELLFRHCTSVAVAVNDEPLLAKNVQGKLRTIRELNPDVKLCIITNKVLP